MSIGVFYLIFIGANLTFFPLHFMGLMGCPRRYIDYPDFMGGWNSISSFGSILSLFGVFLFVSSWVFSCESVLEVIFSAAPSSAKE